jgi:hypothetical protein
MVVKPEQRPLTAIEMQNNAATPGDRRPENAVTPQINIPFGKQPPPAHPTPASNRASAAAMNNDGVSDAAARCESRKGEQVREKCRDQLKRQVHSN